MGLPGGFIELALGPPGCGSVLNLGTRDGGTVVDLRVPGCGTMLTLGVPCGAIVHLGPRHPGLWHCADLWSPGLAYCAKVLGVVVF